MLLDNYNQQLRSDQLKIHLLGWSHAPCPWFTIGL